ncbi:hypothetical protein QR680_016963 [Steinernema hermaphroditum]|uniref:MARVEL domain-containing protein n=1 Tax=Steinernema hermaphroditum TaxID=289476 RepID=A0AA39HF10_9BILA|nr:hypothetical protein QR680_016963 [Steinernema hermaphroditum]
MALSLNTRYLSTNRGLIKIAQIIIGFVICSLLCAHWYGGKSCFGDGRLGVCSTFNFLILIGNIAFFALNFLDLTNYRAERTYSVICCVVFLICSALIIWYVIEYNVERGFLIASCVLIVIQFFLFLWDVKILQGEASN